MNEAYGQFEPPQFIALVDFFPGAVRVNSEGLRVFEEERRDGEVAQDPEKIDPGRFYQQLVDDGAIAEFGDVAGGFFQVVLELRLELQIQLLLRYLHGAAGVSHDLRGFNPRDLVKEPAAAGKHQHGVALEFEHPQNAAFVFGREIPFHMPG